MRIDFWFIRLPEFLKIIPKKDSTYFIFERTDYICVTQLVIILSYRVCVLDFRAQMHFCSLALITRTSGPAG
jgi:hypothetical protein